MTQRLGEHAVVVGASIAGLLAARALAHAYDRVTIVERDRLPAVGEGRKAVPQGRHVHVLLPAGLRCLERLLPGIGEQLVAAGANPFEPGELRFEVAGHPVTREVADDKRDLSISASRPLVEGIVRQRVLALAGVDVVESAKAAGLESDGAGERITGARVAHAGGDEQLLAADLVVAANGRAGQVPAWLEELGYERPVEDRLPVELLYATRRLHPEPGALGDDKWVLIGARPGWPRTLVISTIEGGDWLLTLAGYGSEHHPPAEEGPFMELATEIAPADIADGIRGAEPLGEVATHGFPASQRRRYEKLDRLPRGLLVIGDTVASFNPLYGQGMTVAALEAAALNECLAQGREDLERRFLGAAAEHVDHAWEMAIGSDLALPEIEGERSLRVRMLNGYVDRLLGVAERDPVVATAFREVVGMLAPPSRLMRPRVALRVLRG